MKAQELWNKFKSLNPSIGDEIDAWQFGAEPDLLAKLVVDGTKTATASAYDLYELDEEGLHKLVHMILDFLRNKIWYNSSMNYEASKQLTDVRFKRLVGVQRTTFEEM
ncbi:hypothetical protein, partial [Streptococcus agalactiae]|uniref:hypothetical protein n=1 Tax=Streptococcus agalactiae TaxID=1311 RepID=UPI001F5149D9